MRKIIVQTEISLDAVMENPHFFVFDYHNEEISQTFHDILFGADALIMGRATYEGFAEVWPTRSDEFADKINSMPKYVASRTLQEPLKWNAQLLKGDIAQEVTQLKQQPGQDIVQYGIGELTHTLIQYGLIDEIRLFVFPVVVGKGGRIFEKIDQTAFKLLDTRTFSTGVVELRYQPVRKE